MVAATTRYRIHRPVATHYVGEPPVLFETHDPEAFLRELDRVRSRTPLYHRLSAVTDEGELVLDGVAHLAPCAVLKEPVVQDMTLTCKTYVEPKGKGVRAFEVRFRSSDSVSDQYVHVNRAAAILCWANRDENWNELTRAAVPRHEGRWLDVKVECVRSTVRVYIDGKLVLSRDNVRRQIGRIGFSTSQGLVRYKDIHIEGTAAKLEKPWSIVARPTRFGTFHELPPKHRHTNVSAKLDLAVGKPFIISSRIARPEMGAHEQPHLFKMQNGDIILVFHKDGDIHGATRVVLKSADNGKTWQPFPTPVNRLEAVGVLRDGTVLFYDDYAFRKEADVFVAQMCASKDRGKTFGPLELTEFHRLPNAKSAKAGTYWKPTDLAKYQSTSARASSSRSCRSAPMATCCASCATASGKLAPPTAGRPGDPTRRLP